MPYRATDIDNTVLRLDSVELHTQTCCSCCELDCLPALHQNVHVAAKRLGSPWQTRAGEIQADVVVDDVH